MEIKLNKINKIKNDLRNKDFSSAIALLTAADEVVLKHFKEQRLLLYPDTSEQLISAYIEAANRIHVVGQNLDVELNYVKFISTYIKATTHLSKKVKGLLKNFENRNLKDFLFITNIHLEKYFKSAFKDLEILLAKNNSHADVLEKKTMISEFGHHVLKGRLNDAIFAQLNLVNIFSTVQVEKPNEDFIVLTEEKLIGKLVSAFNISGFLNCYQYALDQISCNEWYVQKVSDNRKGHSIFDFSIVDIDFQKAREIGLQRELASKLMGKQKKRWLRTILEETICQSYDHAWKYYQEENQLLITDNKTYLKFKDQLLQNLDELDAEDELLVGVASQNISIISHYVVVGIIDAFISASEALKNKLPRKPYLFTYPSLPYEEIINLVKRVRVLGLQLDETVIDDYISELPINRHLDLYKAPIIRMKSGKILALEHLAGGGWPTWVRVNLMQGGQTADIIGKAWESYIASILRDNQWTNVVEGFKIKKGGKVATDVDIIAKREDVVLIIQMKVYYGTGVNNYEQWKFRKKLEHAVEQVKISENLINQDLKTLQSIFSKSELNEIKRIKTLVMTNCHYFNGWKLNGIPIMSVGSLMQIINGATVRYTTKEGAVLEEKNYASSQNLTVDEFIDFIDLPLDYRIGTKSYKIRIHTEKLKDATMNFPIFENDFGFDARHPNI
jgi:hypothetical protein